MMERNKTNVVSSPCLILAHAHQDYQTLLARTFRRLGWDVYLAHNGPEARRLVRMLEADVVILHAELPEESGWLTCDKLTREQPLARVILVSDNVSARNQNLAAFVGASALVDPADGVAPLIEELIGTAVHAAS
ncbi:MAG: response regulator [Gemmataceae bacterium]